MIPIEVNGQKLIIDEEKFNKESQFLYEKEKELAKICFLDYSDDGFYWYTYDGDF